ncbi:hypothetical protein Taro_044984, partial [Colocasia esculenta]|nr:hypothetical protein [Colocasia esculenta]
SASRERAEASQGIPNHSLCKHKEIHHIIYIYHKLHSHISTELKESTRAWGISRGTTEENKQLTTLHCWSCYYTAGALNWFATPETDSDKLTQVYLLVSQPRTKGPAAALREKSSNCGDQPNTTTCGPHGHRPMPGTSRDPGPELSRVRHWKRTSWGPIRLLVFVPPTTSVLQVTKDKHKCHCLTVIFPVAGRTTQAQE